MRYYLMSLLALFCLLPGAGIAQEYREKDNLRINPVWLSCIGNSGGTGWIFDAVAHDGCNYSTGGYNSGLCFGDSTKYVVNERKDIFMLICRSNAGELQWIATAASWSRGTAVTAGANGTTVVAGMMNDKNCTFYGADKRDSLTLHSDTYGAAFFICFGIKGNIIKGVVYGPTNDGTDITSIASWGNKGYIVGGSTKFLKPNSPQLRNSLLLLGLDNDLNITLEKRSEPADYDMCFSASADKAGSIYFSGYYNTSFSIDGTTIYGSRNGQSVVGKMDKKGHLQWLLKAPVNVVKNIHAVGKDGIIITGTYAGKMLLFPANDTSNTPVITNNLLRRNGIFAARLNAAGHLQWIAHGESNTEFVWKDSHTDKQGNTYIALGTSGCIFYNAVGTDSLQINNYSTGCLSYGPDGSMRWLKAFEGKYGNEFAAICTDEAGNVILNGHCNENKLTVGDSVIYNNRPGMLFAFSYSKSALEDSSLKGRVVLPKSMQKVLPEWTADCQCKTVHDPDKDERQFKVGPYMPSVSALYDSADWKYMTHTRWPSQKGNGRLAYHNYQTDVSGKEELFFLTMVSNNPIEFTDEDDNFNINMTPCTVDSSYSVRYSFRNIRPNAVNSVYSYNSEEFDPTNRAFYDLLLKIVHMPDSVLLQQTFVNGGNGAQVYLRQVAKKYHIAAPPAGSKSLPESYWGSLATKLKAAGQNVNDVIWDIVLASRFKADELITESTFSMYDHLLELDGVFNNQWNRKYLLYPYHAAAWYTDKVRISFPGGFLVNTDTTNNSVQPHVDPKATYAFLAKTKGKEVNYTDGSGWVMQLGEGCIPSFTVAGTGITAVSPVNLQTELNPYRWEGLNFYFSDINNALKRRDYIVHPNAVVPPVVLGFKVMNGQLTIPAVNDGKPLRSMYLFSNNVFAAELELAYKKDARGNVTLTISPGQEMGLPDLMEALKKCGITNAVNSPADATSGIMYVSFLYARNGHHPHLNTTKDKRKDFDLRL